VVVLGPTGRNFGAGMSGGIAYILDEDRGFERRCNKEMVSISALEDAEEVEQVLGMIRRHAQATGSKRAEEFLVRWAEVRPLFLRVVPNDYGRVLQAQKQMRQQGLSAEEAEMAAFELNTKDAARAYGK
jgi:glutamate synthase (NADPH/NADH) large chain